MKIEKKNRILLYSSLPTGIYHKNLEIIIKKKFKTGEFGSFFSMKNPLYKSKSHFPGQNLAKTNLVV
jgi:hypothetical protein